MTSQLKYVQNSRICFISVVRFY